MINDYAKFVDHCTSNESRETIYFQDRLAGLDNTHGDVHWSRLMTSAIGMLAESGEFTEVMKKILFQGKELGRLKLRSFGPKAKWASGVIAFNDSTYPTPIFCLTKILYFSINLLLNHFLPFSFL